MSLAHHTTHYVPNGCGWSLELKQCRLPKKLNRKRNPVAIIPGYGMNSFIFGYHPHGLSMEDYFTQKGFEVWSINLRNQGGSKRNGGTVRYGLEDLGTVDMRVATDFISSHSGSRTGKVDLIGCSLGGTLSFIYAALVRNNRAGSIVAVGAPLRWEKVHPLLKTICLSPRLIGLLRFPKTKEMIKILFPLFLRSPLIKIYLHKEMVDLSRKDILMETIEDPNRFLNREIASWVNNKDLVFDETNLSREFRKVKNPLLCVLANSDGIVPPLTALSAHEVAGSKIKETIVIGTDTLRFAHADLFISRYCHEMVFEPISNWLSEIGLKKRES